jgi:S1-C subfamily serine protease
MRLRTLFACLCLTPAYCQTQQLAQPGTPSQVRSTAGEIYKQAAASVVSIEGFDERGQVRWTGTGFIVASDGKVITNYHVIRNSKQATVRLANGDAYDSVEVMDIDRRKDIALLKIKAVDLLPIRIGTSSSSQIGDPVYSLSNAQGLDNSLSEGLISGFRQMDGYRLIQITAPISHGSSGGPLFNSKGEVIGITSGSLRDAQSLNFAIPVDYARGILASPSAPRSLEAVYDPEETAPEQVKAAAEPTVVPAVSSANVKVPEELTQSGIAVFLQKRLLSWTEEDARNVFGDPVAHRLGYDNFHNVISDINAYSDPTLLMQKAELAFDAKTKRLTNVYLYPLRMTWEDCKKLWGENVSVQRNLAANDGSKFHIYKDRHLNVLLDRHNNVVSLGIY